MTENPLERALLELSSFLEKEGIPYMVIGAVAGLAWGLRRATFDVDVTIWAAGREEELARRLCERFAPRVSDPQAFVAQSGVLPVTVSGTDADILFGRLSYEEAAIRRAKPLALAGRTLRVCSAEDLIVHKVISERPKDWEDIGALARAMGEALDRRYLDPIVKGLATDLARPELWERFLAAVGAGAP